VVDPETVRLLCEPAEHVSCGALWSASGASAVAAGRVWMKGRVQSVRLTPSGTLVTCEVGRAVVSALLAAIDGSSCRWGTGMVVELSVAESEVWIRPCEGGGVAVQCDLLYLTPEGDVHVYVSSGGRLQAEACRPLLLGK